MTSVAIPFGYYDRRVIKHLSALPFERIYTSDTGPSEPGDRFVRRNPVMADHSPGDVADILDDKVPFCAPGPPDALALPQAEDWLTCALSAPKSAQPIMSSRSHRIEWQTGVYLPCSYSSRRVGDVAVADLMSNSVVP